MRCKSCAFEWHAVTNDLPPKPSTSGTGLNAEATGPAAEETPGSPQTSALGIEAAARRRMQFRLQRGKSRGFDWPAMAVAASFVLGILSLYPLRNTVTSLVPAAVPLYNLIGIQINLVGFDFDNVRVAREFDNGLPVLTVVGDVVNVSGKAMPAPRVRFGLRDDGQQEIYHWTVAVSDEPLEPGARARFSTRLAAPPKDAYDILVRFNSGSGRRQAFLPTSSKER